MARAKTTDRAEARRRYRAQLAAEAGAADEAGDEATTGSPARSRPPAKPSTPSPAARMSIVQGFRAAAAPADIRADIQALPWIARRTKAIWLPAVLIVATGVAFLIPALAQNEIVRFLGVALLAPPPMIPAFLAGMLTPRGSWLAGGIAGLVAGIVVALLVTLSPAATSSAQGLDVQNLGFLLIAGPGFGMAVGAFAGFYRRFLALSAPQRQARSTQASKNAKRR